VKTNFYSRSWSAKRLNLDGEGYIPGRGNPAPLLFNVIDTSDIKDYLSFLNLVVAVVPLLTFSPASVLFTDTLTTEDYELSLLSDLLCGNTGAMCALIGIVPTTYLTGTTTERRAFENSPEAPHRERISWKLAECFDSSSQSPSLMSYTVHKE